MGRDTRMGWADRALEQSIAALSRCPAEGIGRRGSAKLPSSSQKISTVGIDRTSSRLFASAETHLARFRQSG